MKKIHVRNQLRNTAKLHWIEDKKRLHDQFLDVTESVKKGNIVHLEIDYRLIMFSISYLKDDSKPLRGTPGSKIREKFLVDMRECGHKVSLLQKQANWSDTGSQLPQNLTLPPEILDCVNLSADPSI